MNRKAVWSRIRNRRSNLFCMTLGSGIYYKYAEANDIDLAFLISASRFRQMGVNSLAATMPYGNANEIVFQFSTREILTQKPKIPLIFGLCATDPTIDMDAYLEKLKEHGFSGICNIPSVIIVDGKLGSAMSASGFSYQKEVDAIRLAREKELFTVAMVKDKSQAEEMIDAGCDAVCVHFGAAKGGMLGAKQEITQRQAVETASEIYETCGRCGREVIRLFYGGPAKTPSSVRFILESTHADGFVGGYSIEKWFVEAKMREGHLRDAFLGEEAHHPPKNGEKFDYAEYARTYIEQNYKNEISVNALAELLHISRTHLSTVLSRELGEPFQEYIIRFRMEKASNLLINTPLSIEEIANCVGYRDYIHFSKSFKKKMGISPSAYRKQYKNT